MNSYWNHTGKYEKEDRILWDTYIPSRGINLTDNESLNKIIKKFRKSSKAYYRYYNDGDRVPGITHRPKNYINSTDIRDQQKLEAWMDKIILRLWKASKKGTIKVTRYEEN